MRSFLPTLLAALTLASCQPMHTEGEKALDPHKRPAAAPTAGKADAKSPAATNPHATNPHADLGDATPHGGSPGMGFMPDYGGAEGGLGVSDVRPDGPAARAGLQPGDVITKFAGIPITDVHAYMAALDTVKVGDEVEIVVKRGADTKTLKGTVGTSMR